METLDDYLFVGPIGAGTFSRVYKAVSKKTQRLVAIKEIDITKVKDFGLIEREIEISSTIKHKYVAEIYSVINEVETRKKLYIVMEYVENGTLLNYVNERTKLSEAEAKKFFIQLVDFINYIHSYNIVHRDLKCENIMLDRNNNIKIVDFGLSRKIEEPSSYMATFCGSAQYAAPEVLMHLPYTHSIDIWSLGVVLYAMVHGRLPFESNNQLALINQIIKSEPSYDRNLSGALLGILQGMLDKNPESRMSIREIISHPWIKDDFPINIFYGPRVTQNRPKMQIHNSASFNQPIKIGDIESKSVSNARLIEIACKPKKSIPLSLSTSSRMFSLMNVKIGATIRKRELAAPLEPIAPRTFELTEKLPPLL
ncbi:CAMK family protein kinase [Tritrichomonas foetus]|uniref:CAMK family protein kinase n=1 Tax=Tritrichomonas foetus TaxID=1144522 RepID=A0A1J4JCP5_9EUKA|nr:CAMK family protein kinase [Tritrichomonas foetus]|eukprot:OHS96950.1 CAMK family protein kinase [Tritrichomonas foetus]